MDDLFTRHNVEVLDYKRLPISDELAKPWTDMQLMANRDFVENDIIPSCTESSTPSQKEWREVLEGVALECGQGIKITMDMLYIVGRKK